jgi:hypothetical protein
VEFQTEAGHAETVFDLEFCPSNKDLIASNKHQMDLLQQKYDLQKKLLDQLKENNEQKIKEYEN